jgi:hypothetical protein
MTQISGWRRHNVNLIKRQTILDESSKCVQTAEELKQVIEMQRERIAQRSHELMQIQLRCNVGRRVSVSSERLQPMNPIEPE